MSLSNVQCEPVLIPIGTAVSQIVRSRDTFDDAASISLFGPTALDGGHTYIIEVTYDPDAAVPVWNTLQANDPPTDVSPPGASKARTYYDLPTYKGFRIKDSTGNVAANRSWLMVKNIPIHSEM
jgi:hypothetical protein